MNSRFVRNFSIIAHIDHGKSTLADRFLEITGALQAREMEAQVLDTMDLERERGITIKAHAVRLNYTARTTARLRPQPHRHARATSISPTRSRGRSPPAKARCCWSMPRRASRRRRSPTPTWRSRTTSRSFPVINKIDLPGAEPDEARRQIEEIIGLDADGAILASAKEGIGIGEILEAIVQRAPAAHGRSRRAAQGADLRLLVRRLPRRRDRRSASSTA